MIKDLCKKYASEIEIDAPWLDGEVLLQAIAMVESSYGKFNVPKHEKAYDLGGVYANKQHWAKYGSWAACSYSSWQIMFPVAIELGFAGSPMDLWHDETAINYVVKLIKKRILQKGAKELSQVFDAYNSGSFKDSIIPKEYIIRGLAAYKTFHDQKFNTITA